MTVGSERMLRATFQLRPAGAAGVLEPLGVRCTSDDEVRADLAAIRGPCRGGDGLLVLRGSRAYDPPGGLEAALGHAVESL